MIEHEAPGLIEHLHAMGRFDLSSMLTRERIAMFNALARQRTELERLREIIRQCFYWFDGHDDRMTSSELHALLAKEMPS